MFSALFRAIAHLGETSSRRVIAISISGAIAGFVLLAGLIWFALFKTRLIEWGWLDTTVDVLGGLVVFGLAYLLFPAVVGAIAGLLLDDVADSVERRYYPLAGPARHQKIGEVMVTAARFFLVVIGFNILVLPLYFVPIINLFVYYALNGYLLSREYFELVALRRMDQKTARSMRRAHALRLFLAGVTIAFLLTIPLVNLIVPVVATAFMVHIFHGLGRSPRRTLSE